MAYTVGSASVEIVPDFRKAQLEITKFFTSQQDKVKVPVQLDIDERTVRQTEKQAEGFGQRLGKAINDGAAKNDIAAVKQAQKTANAIAAARRKAEDQAAADGARARDKQFRDDEKRFQQSIRNQLRAMGAAIKDGTRERLKIEVDENDAQKKGKNLGGIVMRATREEIHQNAGLIAAAIAGVLAAGAPVALAASTALFAGIGAAGAFQNDKLRQSWLGLWTDIKSGAVADAATLVPVFDRMAGAIGQSFQRMRPLMRDAFEAVGPQIDSLTASLVRTAENALPGLVRAVQNAGPVVSGLGDLFEKTGTGLSDFFDRISTHSPAAGHVLDQLGDSMSILLPLLGELIGQGAELAATVLPSVNSALGVLLQVATSLGGALPVLGTAFLSFRLAQGATRYIENLSIKMTDAAALGGMFSARMGQVGSALAKVGNAMPAIGAGAAVWGIIFQQSASQINKWTTALNGGGDAARKAQQDMAGYDSTMGKIGTALDTTAAKTNVFTASTAWAWKLLSNDTDEAKKANEEYIKSLTPLESAQRNVGIASKALAEALGDENTTSSELSKRKADLAKASARQAAEEDKLAMATRGVTEAMAEQADAALARTDAAFGYQQSVIDTAEAQADLKKAIESTDYDTPQEKIDAITQRTLDYNKALLDQVEAAGKAATTNLPASMDDTQRSVLGAKAQLDELNKLLASGVPLPPELMALKTQLEAVASGADTAALEQAQLVAALGEVGAAVENIPGTKAVKIEAPTDELRQRLVDLGFLVTEMPDGSIRVEAETEQAKGNLDNLSVLLADLGITVAEPTTILNDQASDKIRGVTALADFLGLKRPTPTAAVNDQASNPFKNITALSDFLNGRRPTPTAAVNDQASARIQSIISQINSIPAYRETVIRTVHEVVNKVTNVGEAMNPWGADGGAVGDMPLKQAPRYADGGAAPTYTRFDGAIYGRGGPRDDLVPMLGSPGEHMLDAHDVALMGGQAGVYAFREMLNSGALRRPASDTGVRQMVAAGAPRLPQQQQAGSMFGNVQLYTPDIPTAIRELGAAQHRAEALAPAW